MTNPANTFAFGRRSGPCMESLRLAWSDAADDACEAYVAWRDANQSARADAFIVYRAALDREQAAASALQHGAIA